MRLEQLHVLYHENLCGWNSYYTTRTCAVGRTIISREPCIWMIGAVGQTCSVRGPREMYSFLLAHLSRRLKGELIVYWSIRRPCVRPCVNIFKLEYLRNQWANCNQILSEASLGWGTYCIRF